MKKIAILSSNIILGFYEPNNPAARAHSLHEKGGSGDDLSHHMLDYQALTHTLRKHDIAYDLVAWNDPSNDWAKYDAVLIHTPWDYFEDKGAFLNTLRAIESKTVLLNSFKTVEWNIDKKYLQDVKRCGNNVIETVFINTNTVDDVIDKIPSYFWEKGCIFKPSVSAGAADVFLIRDAIQAKKTYLEHFKNKHETLMIQPFMEEIQQEGEWSFIFFNGQYSHGVLKKAINDGFTVKHSVENQKYVPTSHMVEEASNMFQRLEAIRQDNPLYTRIDTIKCADGQLYIMEVEQIEPYLYLHATQDAAEHLVEGIKDRINAV